MASTEVDRFSQKPSCRRKNIASWFALTETGDVERALDEIDIRLLDALQNDARIPQSALGTRVGRRR